MATNPNDPVFESHRCTDEAVKEARMNFPMVMGLTKREYFAAHADVSWNAVMSTLKLKGNAKPTVGEMMKARAQIKVLEADALILELNKEPKP